MNTYIFIPDTNKKAGLGHLFRCIKYSSFIKKQNKIFFLIQKNFNKRYLVKKNLTNSKINYIFFDNLYKSLRLLKNNYRNIITFLDSYNLKLQKSDFKKFSKKHINVLDFKTPFKSDYVIDHTFMRKFGYHKNKNSKIYFGIKNFPILYRLKFLKKNIILIDFGSVKKKKLINKSLLFLKSLKLNKKYKIVIISKYFSKKNFLNLKIDNKIVFYKFVDNIDKIYRKTFFSFGACGISLYERCFYNIPSISKSLAKNQYFNFKNFTAKGCILDFDKVTKLNISNVKNNNNKIFKKLIETKKNIKRNFDYKKNKKHLINLFNEIDEN